MTTLTPTRLAAMPRVNLLPPEIAAAAKLKQLRFVLGLMVVAVIAGVVALWVLTSGQVSSAQENLTQAEATGQQLNAEKASYAEVDVVYLQVDTAQANLVTAMTPEIRWSFYLNDLSLTIPKTTRLTTMTAVNDAAAAQLAAGTTVAAPTTEDTTGDATTVTPALPMGSITFSGKSTDFNAVAAWLQTLSREAGFTNPFVQNIAKGESETAVGEWFDVDSSTKLDNEAASNRYQQIGTGE